MARGGFLGRIARAVRNVIAPSPPPRPPPREPPREPPRQPPSRDDYREEWKRQRGRGNYKKNLRVFHKLVDPVEAEPSEQRELWTSYLRNINRGEGQFRRQDNANLFWRDTGIDPRSFDWAAWRQAMGYTGKRRSRTP